MKRSLSLALVLALVLVALVAPEAQAQRIGSPQNSRLDAAAFHRTFADSIAGSARDTLWFTKETPNTNAGLFTNQARDWYAPILVPVGSNSAGDLVKITKRVKRVTLYSRTTFTAKLYQSGGLTSPAPALADTAGTATANGRFRFQLVVDYPDSIRVNAGTAAVYLDLDY